MAERASYGLAPRLDIQQLQFEALHRWLRPAEICEILRNYRMFQITPEPPNKPPSGSLFLFDRKVLRYFRKDGHSWRKKKDGKTVKEAHEKLKVGSIDMLHCYYAHGEENENFQRRSYWMLEPDMMHIVFVHYLDVKVNKANIGVSTNSDGVTSDSQKDSSVSSDFPANYGNVPSGSMYSMSPTSTLTSLCEDADSEDIHQASSGLHPYCEPQNPRNGWVVDKIDPRSDSSYPTYHFSGDHHHGKLSISGTSDLPLVQGGKSRQSDNACIEDKRAHDLASWYNIMEQSAGLHNDPSPVSSSSVPSSSIGNILEEENTAFTEVTGAFQSLQSNWQIPFEDNTEELAKWRFTQSLGLEFQCDYSTGLPVKETNDASLKIGPALFTFNCGPKEQSVPQDFSKQHANAQSLDAQKSEGEVHGEGSINFPLTMKHAFLDGEESLKKVDSFSRWITKELAAVDDLHMQSSPGISWSTDECGNVIDDTSLNPSLSQDQQFSIIDFSPKWAYAEPEIEVLIIGSFLKSQLDVKTCKWSCMFGEVEVPAVVLANGILCCQAPPHEIGRVPFYLTCSNRFACSEVREFEYREGFAGNVDPTAFFSTAEIWLYSRLEELLSQNSVHPSSQISEDDMEKRNLVLKLISLKEEEEYSSNEEPTVEVDISNYRLNAHIFHRKVKEKLYSWLLHKVTETGKGPHLLCKDGQGVLHLVAALGYDWAIAPIVTAGVNINFRDVDGCTALHWAALCGRERTVALLVSMGAAAGALTDPCPAFPSGRTPADFASSNGHKGISGFLAESLLTSHLESLTVDDADKNDGKETSGGKVAQPVPERIATPVLYGDIPDAICLKDSLNAVRNATQAVDRIHQVFRMQSFQRKQLAQYEDGNELGMSDQQALSLLASKACKSRQGAGLANTAAVQIQKKFRGWTKRKEFLFIRQRVVTIQAHVRGHQVRKKYKSIIWSVGILEKVILRWRRKGSGLRGFRPDTLNKLPDKPSDPLKEEDDYDFLKEGRKQSEVRFQKALSRVKSMVQYPEARAQYRRLLNVVDDFRQTKACHMSLINSEEAVDGMEDLIDIDMLLDDDNFLPIAFD